jgi:hypothetical protein
LLLIPDIAHYYFETQLVYFNSCIDYKTSCLYQALQLQPFFEKQTQTQALSLQKCFNIIGSWILVCFLQFQFRTSSTKTVKSAWLATLTTKCAPIGGTLKLHVVQKIVHSVELSPISIQFGLFVPESIGKF